MAHSISSVCRSELRRQLEDDRDQAQRLLAQEADSRERVEAESAATQEAVEEAIRDLEALDSERTQLRHKLQARNLPVRLRASRCAGAVASMIAAAVRTTLLAISGVCRTKQRLTAWAAPRRR